MSAGFERDDQVTVRATDRDPYILQFQRYARVSRVTVEGVFVTLDATVPPDQEFGPLQSGQLVRGWKDNSGRWRDR
jgi:hypothetical protein